MPKYLIGTKCQVILKDVSAWVRGRNGLVHRTPQGMVVQVSVFDARKLYERNPDLPMYQIQKK